jgi:hypothetical protein
MLRRLTALLPSLVWLALLPLLADALPSPPPLGNYTTVPVDVPVALGLGMENSTEHSAFVPRGSNSYAAWRVFTAANEVAVFSFVPSAGFVARADTLSIAVRPLSAAMSK